MVLSLRTPSAQILVLDSTKGAAKFISLVEKQLEALSNVQEGDGSNSSLLFEKLVVDMIDLSVGEGILSSTDIPAVLSKKGWDFGQVATAWTVPSEPLEWSTWNYGSLDYLGGNNTLSRVWSLLREDKLTSHVKRKVEEGSPVKVSKLPRYDKSTARILSVMAKSSIDTSSRFGVEMTRSGQSLDRSLGLNDNGNSHTNIPASSPE